MSVISNETVLSVRKESDSAGEVDVPAATLNEQGDRVHCFSYHDAPRQAHYIAAQGINIAKNYRNDKVDSSPAGTVAGQHWRWIATASC